MPTLEEVLARLAKAKVFSTLDAKDDFYQIGLDQESSMKTAFRTVICGYLSELALRLKSSNASFTRN